MAKYRKRPVVIEAFQYRGDIREFPQWAHAYIDTLEGQMRVGHGDYVIRGVEGELYPCKSEIFEKTYELVENE